MGEYDRDIKNSLEHIVVLLKVTWWTQMFLLGILLAYFWSR